MLRFAITPGLCAATASSRAALAARCATLHADLLLIREKHLSAHDLLLLCRALRPVFPGRLLVSSRPDIALAAGLDGVHLTSAPGELTPRQVRQLGVVWVSVSCHTVADVIRAQGFGADAALFGPVFGKTVAGTEAVAGVGLESLRGACRVGLPVFALGGVTEADLGACERAGASGIAAIRLFFG